MAIQTVHLGPFDRITSITFPPKDESLPEHPHFWPGVLWCLDNGDWSVIEGPGGPEKLHEFSYQEIPLFNARVESIVDGPGEWVGLGPDGAGSVTNHSSFDPLPGSTSESDAIAPSEDADEDWLYDSGALPGPDHSVFSRKTFGDFRVRQTAVETDGLYFDFFRISRDSDDEPKATDGGGTVTIKFQPVYISHHYPEELTFKLQIWKGGFLEVTKNEFDYTFQHFHDETNTEGETGQNPGGDPFVDAHKTITVDTQLGDPAFPTFDNPQAITLPDLTINLDDGTWSW